MYQMSCESDESCRKVDEKGPLTPPLSSVCVAFFSSRLLGLKKLIILKEEAMVFIITFTKPLNFILKNLLRKIQFFFKICPNFFM